MKRNSIYMLLLLCISCVSADPGMTTCTINKDTFDWDYKNPVTFENDTFNVTMVINRNSRNIIKEIYYKYSMDGEPSAQNFLYDSYDICLIDVCNKSNAEEMFLLSRFSISGNNGSFYPLSPIDIPAEINRINPKGISKNVYNTLAVITVTAAVIVVATSVPTIPLPYHNESFLEKKEKKELWSGMYHSTKYEYEDLIIDKNSIKPLSCKKGIIFIKKGAVAEGSRMKYQKD